MKLVSSKKMEKVWSKHNDVLVVILQVYQHEMQILHSE